MMAELFGETGSCKGKGGSMHIADLEKGMLGANGIVGAGSPLARRGAHRQAEAGRAASPSLLRRWRIQPGHDSRRR